MTLSQLLETLTTTGVQVNLVDMETGSGIAEIKASDYTALEDIIESREVKQWSIISTSHIKVVLGDAVTP